MHQVNGVIDYWFELSFLRLPSFIIFVLDYLFVRVETTENEDVLFAERKANWSLYLSWTFNIAKNCPEIELNIVFLYSLKHLEFFLPSIELVTTEYVNIFFLESASAR